MQMDDAWAEKLLPGASGLAGLKATMKKAAAAQRESDQRERIADAFTAAIGKAVDCDVPASLINELGAQQYRCGVCAVLPGVPMYGTDGNPPHPRPPPSCPPAAPS